MKCTKIQSINRQACCPSVVLLLISGSYAWFECSSLRLPHLQHCTTWQLPKGLIAPAPVRTTVIWRTGAVTSLLHVLMLPYFFVKYIENVTTFHCRMFCTFWGKGAETVEPNDHICLLLNPYFFICFIVLYYFMSQFFSAVATLWAGQSETRGSILGTGKSFYFLWRVQSDSGSHPASYPAG